MLYSNTSAMHHRSSVFFHPLYLVSVVCSMLLFFSGCGSTNQDIVSDSQTIVWDRFSMVIDQRFISTDITTLINPVLRQSIIQAYSIPSPSSEFFEKNIIISRESSPSADLTEYAHDVAYAIQQTWWGYVRSSLSAYSFDCGATSIPWFIHDFSLTRGSIAATWWQTLFFVQYIFASDDNFYILSASTDDENDTDAFQWYRETIGCIDDTVLTGQIE